MSERSDAAPADTTLARLRAWRATAEGRPGVDEILDSDLAQIARSAARTPRAIRGMLPASAGDRADEIAAAMEGDDPPLAPTWTRRGNGAPGSEHGGTPAVAGPAPSAPSAPADAHPEAVPRPATPSAEASPTDSLPPSHSATGTPTDPAPPTTPSAEASPTDSLSPSRPATGNGSTPPATDAPAEQEPLESLAFAPPTFEWSADAAERIEVTPGAQGTVLRWPAAPPSASEPVVIYRVGSAENYPPYSPDAADPIAATTDRRATDRRPFTQAVRVVRVWTHRGATVDDARQNPPVLHAEAAVVAPVQEAALAQTEGGVVGQWRVLPGTTGVTVLRVPIEHAHRGAGDPRYRILADRDNLGGLDDRGVVPGQRYLYQLIAVAEVDGVAETSAPVNHEVDVTAPLVGVTDLGVLLHEGSGNEAPDGGRPTLELRWSPTPAGRVVVYRTAEPPAPDVHREAVAEGGLRGAGLPDDARLLHPLTEDDQGRPGMDRVPWPSDSHVAHLTPVTLLDGRARVGTSVAVVRVGPVTDMRLVERTSTQTITFGWPEGAGAVRLYRGALDQDPRTATTGSWEEISHGRYLRDGGMILDEPLPARGCSVHLLGAAFHGGQTYTGPPSSQNYGGLLRLRYVVAARRTLRGRLTGLTLKIESQLDLPTAPTFVLVHHPDRLPLSVRDGHPLPVAPEGDGSAAAMRFSPAVLGAGAPELTWVADAQGLQGFVRLFVDVDDEHRMGVALLDPPVGDLQLEPSSVRPPWWRRR